MEDTDLDSERFLISRWRQAAPVGVRGVVSAAWAFGRRIRGERESLDPYAITQQVLDILSQIGCEFVVGGSIASSFYGEPRYTQDTDVEVRIDSNQLDRLLAKTQGNFYSSEAAAKDALRNRSSFNLIHFGSSYKVAVFVSRERPFDRSRLARRCVPNGFASNFWISSVEDMILVKLEWYRSGRALSDRQWRDVLAMLAARFSELDREYLDLWSRELGVDDLLAQALVEIEPLI